MNTIAENRDIEVDEQPKAQLHCLQIGNQLRLVYWRYLVNGFQFHQQFATDQEIRSTFADRMPLGGSRL